VRMRDSMLRGGDSFGYRQRGGKKVKGISNARTHNAGQGGEGTGDVGRAEGVNWEKVNDSY